MVNLKFNLELHGAIKLYHKKIETKTWINDTSDIWYATKTEDFLFKQQPVSSNIEESIGYKVEESNLWIDIPGYSRRRSSLFTEYYI